MGVHKIKTLYSEFLTRNYPNFNQADFNLYDYFKELRIAKELVAILAVKELIISSFGKNILVNKINYICVDAKKRNLAYSKSLMNQACQSFSDNYLMTIAISNQSDLMEKYQFQKLYNLKKYLFPNYLLQKIRVTNITKEYDINILYQLYQNFCEFFDFYLDDFNYFKARIEYYLSQKYTVILYHENSNYLGFCLYRKVDNYIEVPFIIYNNNRTLLMLLAYASFRIYNVSVTVSEFEKLEIIDDKLQAVVDESVFMKINDLNLLYRLYHKEKSLKEILNSRMYLHI